MPPNIYSERILARSGQGGSNQYVVPAAKRLVVKTCSGLNSAASAATAYVSIAGVVCWYASLAGAGQLPPFSGMAVAYAGEIVQLVTTGNSVSAQVSGFLFDA